MPAAKTDCVCYCRSAHPWGFQRGPGTAALSTNGAIPQSGAWLGYRGEERKSCNACLSFSAAWAPWCKWLTPSCPLNHHGLKTENVNQGKLLLSTLPLYVPWWWKAGQQSTFPKMNAKEHVQSCEKVPAKPEGK